MNYLKSAASGAAIGSATSALFTSIKNRDKSSDQKKSILSSAGTGAVIGAGVGLSVKAVKDKYKSYIGSPKIKQVINESIKYQPGDIIIADRGFMKHYGVVVDSKGSIVEFGSKTHDPRMSAVRKVSLEEFRGNSPLFVEKPSGKFTRDEIIKRANSSVGKNNGAYNLRENNCEHFARNIVNGERTSTQVNEKLGKYGSDIITKAKKIITPKMFSYGTAPELLTKNVKLLRNNLLNSDLIFKARGGLTKELGGLSHINKYQSHYISGASGIAGAGIGSKKAKKRAKEDAKKYNLKEGTLEYDDFIKRRKREGALKGATVGAGIGYGVSKGIDAARGKVISDKIRVKYGHDLSGPNQNYMKFGKNMRGIRSEAQVDSIMKNWDELIDYAKAGYKAL